MTEQTSDATPRGPYRRFTDHAGGNWLVWRITEREVEEIREEPSLGRAWLIFLSPNGETRRLAPVPARWRRLTDAELHALAEAAKPFNQRRPR